MHNIKNLIPQSIKNIYHLAQAVAANVWYGWPSKKLKVIGITGTNGKTTTTLMIAKILEEAGKRVAMVSTINFSINGQEEKKLSHFTTESAFAVQKFIKRAVQAGCEYVVLETSSHSLDQYRVWGVQYDTAVITNVTREHLDYHQTMEKYREAKKMLFANVAKNNGTIVVNLDMERPDEYLQYDADKKFGYTTRVNQELARLDSQDDLLVDARRGIMNKEVEIVQAEDIQLGIASTRFMLHAACFMLHVPGIFNVENALAATCVGLSEGIGLEAIKAALEKIKGVPGRLEAVENDLGAHILVDYAVTPDSLEKLYSFIQVTKEPGANIIAVFGSCGDRDKGKRPIMGEIVSCYADQIILTNEEPYHEDPQAIIDEIASGIKNKKEHCWKIIDRREAIAKALSLAKSGDIVVVSGMGAQESMIVGDKKIPWNDRKVIEEELAKRG
jgi:UDP-N-acetylmuramoyl-L-alanyl-D-glutamate--2,6-diaminopimelate ligase